jgi:hypothetical protein
MNSYISLALAAERAKDMQGAAAASRDRREARQARRAARRRPLVTEQTLHGGQAPDSYEDFLCQTARSVMREPTAARRSHGHAVR